MTLSSKNFEKILEQSQTSRIDHLKVLRKLEVLRWTYLTVQTSRSFRATGHDLFDQPSVSLFASCQGLGIEDSRLFRKLFIYKTLFLICLCLLTKQIGLISRDRAD